MLLNPERGGHDLRHRSRITDRPKLHEPRAVPIARQALGRDLQRQPRLAHTPDTRERHHPTLVERRDDLRDLRVAADERRDLRRQIPRKRLQRLQRRELARADLEHPLRAGQVPQRVLTQIDQLDATILDQFLGRERHHDLATVRRRHQSRRPIHRSAVIITVA